MARNVFLLCAVIAGLGLGSCATASSIGGTADPHGLISKAPVVAEGATAIASYSVILGLVDSKYPEYAAAVKSAQAAGQTITTVTKWFVFLTKTTAYTVGADGEAPVDSAEDAPAERTP